MQIALKRQAETYFQNIADFDSAYQDSIKNGGLEKFYVLLLSKFLTSEQLITKIVGLHTSKKIQWNTFIDAIWGYSLMLTEDSLAFKALTEFVSEIDRKNIVDRSFLMKSLPQNLIDAANLEKKATLEKKAKRGYTKFYYDQQKHNLFRENNQGYARLCLLLSSMTKSHDSQAVWNKILSLIGNFDLDPDRVLDLLIESYVQSTNTQICLKLIKNFNPQSIVALIGNKIVKDCPADISQKITYVGKVENFLTSSQQQIYKQLNNFVHPKLIILSCLLIKSGFISVESILPYLNPIDTIFQRQQTKRLNNGKQKISKSFKLMMQQLTAQEQFKLKQQQNVKFHGQLLHSSKLALFNGFINVNDWRNFMKIWKNYVEKVDLIIYQPMLKSLLQMLQWIIDPLYKKINLNDKFFKTVYELKIKFNVDNRQTSEEQPRKQMTQSVALEDKQFKKIVQIFQVIKIYIGFNSKLFIKICRLFKAIIKQPTIFLNKPSNQSQIISEQISISTYIKQSIQSIIKLYLLPGMSLQVGNSALTKQIYQLLEQFDYRFRYRCYLYFYAQGMMLNPCLSNIFYKTRNKQIIIVNNLSDKNKKVFMKKMAKLTHNQPLQTFYWIFRRIMMEDYEKVVPQIVGVLANCCSLTLEMSIFNALHILNEQKQPAMNFKTGQQSAWFKNLINFISLFYRKYLEIDIQPVFDYIIMKIGQDVSELQNNQQLPGALLGLLHQILSKMFCNFVLKEVNKNKLEMLCAGPQLQLQTMDISSQIKASKKSKVILQKFFWGKSLDQYDGQSLAISLLVLLTQKRAQLLHKSYISNLKIIGDIYDDYTTLIIQLIRVLNQLSNQQNKYQKLLPQSSLNLLINQYKLPLQISFQIFRPASKHISIMKNEQWTQFVSYIGSVMDKFVKSDQKFIQGSNQNQKAREYLNQNYSKMSSVMSYEFFTTFWMLTLDSIYFPSKLYSQKIDQVKKKYDNKMNRNKNQRNDRQTEKARTLYYNLKTEEENQSKKVNQTTSVTNIGRLKLDYLKNVPKDQKNNSVAIQTFAQIFTQICLLPRMMLDPQQALYCVKITLQIIKVNKLSSGKSVKLLIFIIQHVMNSLPYATQRQASYCLAIFLSQILSVIANWNDQPKLKQDMKKFLGIEQNFVEQNFLRLKKQFLKLYVRFGNIVRSIREEPYNIRNSLYLLQKVDIIPAYKKQAEDLQNYLKQMKQKHPMQLATIIQMQLSLIGQKKKNLPVIQQDGPTQSSSAIRNQAPTFSNIPLLIEPIKNPMIPITSPYRSPYQNKNQSLPSKSPNINKNQNTDKISLDSVNKSKYDKKDNKLPGNQSQRERNKLSKQQQKNKQKSPQVYKQMQKLPAQSPPQIQPQSQNLIILTSQSNQSGQIKRQVTFGNGQKQQKKNIINTQNAISTIVPQKIQPQKANLPAITQLQKKTQQQRPQEFKSQPPAQRIKTVKQIRQENARKAVQSNSNLQETASKITIQLQQNEKIKKQNQKDQVQIQVHPRDQKASWPNQNQKEKTYQATVQFNNKTNLEDKRNNQTQIRNKPTIQEQQQTTRQKLEQPIIEIRPKQKQQKSQIITPTIKAVQEKRQQDSVRIKQQHHSKSHDKSQDKQREKYRQNKPQWKKIDKQDKYSPEKNQDRQRQYKRESRPYDKRQKEQRTDSRWKERQDYRDKHNEDRSQRRKQEGDRNKRKQDRYDRDRGRKDDRKQKDRSRDRQHNYRK